MRRPRNHAIADRGLAGRDACDVRGRAARRRHPPPLARRRRSLAHLPRLALTQGSQACHRPSSGCIPAIERPLDARTGSGGTSQAVRLSVSTCTEDYHRGSIPRLRARGLVFVFSGAHSLQIYRGHLPNFGARVGAARDREHRRLARHSARAGSVGMDAVRADLRPRQRLLHGGRRGTYALVLRSGGGSA